MELSKIIKTKLYEQNTRMVYYVFNTMIIKSQLVLRNKEDIMQEGFVGLWKSCLDFDETKGVKFSTYAITNIKMYMLNYIHKLINKNNVEDSFDCMDYKVSQNCKTVFTINNKSVIEYSKNCDELADKENDIFIEQIFEKYPKDYIRVIELSKQGKTQQEISCYIGVSQMQVSRMLKKVKQIILDNYMS